MQVKSRNFVIYHFYPPYKSQKYKAIEAETMEKKELEDRVVNKVAEVISAIKNAKHVDHVISSLHSIATLLFPLDPNLLSGSRFFNPRTQQSHFILFFIIPMSSILQAV